jgi:hypothetical protein
MQNRTLATRLTLTILSRMMLQQNAWMFNSSPAARELYIAERVAGNPSDIFCRFRPLLARMNIALSTSQFTSNLAIAVRR